MPKIVHACGAKLTFAPEMAGRTGKCPTCGEPVTVPAIEPVAVPPPPPPPAARGGLAPRPLQPRSDLEKIELDPPPHWDEYQAFIDGKGPNPRPTIIPANLMLKEEADAKWHAGVNKAPQSKFSCPGCKTRLEVGAFVCTKCGLDLKTGKTLDGKSQLNDTGIDYLSQIPWLKDGPEEFSPGGKDGDEDEDSDKGGSGKKPRFPKLRKPRRPS
jgi:hypothetical protein